MIRVDETDPVGEVEPSFPYRDVRVRRGIDFKEQYDVQSEIGRGKFGTVYRCKEKTNGLLLAAKVVGVEKKEDRRAVEREVEIMRRLQHPRLIQLYDAIDNGKQIYVILELIEGGELFERVIDDDFILTERSCAVFMRQICEGIEFIHAQNILHLDLKPENILCLTKMGNRIKIIDFGLAREYDPNKKLQVLFGTPEFVAPEVVNFDQIGFGTDMWSVGVICYVLLSGLSPFMGDTDIETMANVTIAKYDFDHEAFAEISENAKDFIRCLLVKDKEKRNSASMCRKHSWLVVKKERRASPPKITKIQADTDLELEELEKSKGNLRTFVERWREHPYSPYVLENFGTFKDFDNFDNYAIHRSELQFSGRNVEAENKLKSQRRYLDFKGFKELEVNTQVQNELKMSRKNLEADNDRKNQRGNSEMENELQIHRKDLENDLKIHRKNLKLENDFRDQKRNLEEENDFKIYRRDLGYSREIENYKEDLKSPEYMKNSRKVLEYGDEAKISKKILDCHQSLRSHEEMISLRGNSPSTRSSLSSLISESADSSSKENQSSYLKKSLKNQFFSSDNSDKDQFSLTDNSSKKNKFPLPENLSKENNFSLPTSVRENQFLLPIRFEENKFSFLKNSKDNHLSLLEIPGLSMERRASEGCTNQKSRFDLERKIFLAEEIVKLSEKLRFVTSENIQEKDSRKKEDISSNKDSDEKRTVIPSENLRMIEEDISGQNLRQNREEFLDKRWKIKKGQKLSNANSEKNKEEQFSGKSSGGYVAELPTGNSRNEIEEKLSSIASNRKMNGTSFRRNQSFTSNLNTTNSFISVSEENRESILANKNLRKSEKDSYANINSNRSTKEFSSSNVNTGNSSTLMTKEPIDNLKLKIKIENSESHNVDEELFNGNRSLKKLEKTLKTAEEFSTFNLNVRKPSISISEKPDPIFRERINSENSENSENLAETEDADLCGSWRHRRAKKSFGEISRDVPRDSRLQNVHKDLNLNEPSTTKDLLLRLLLEWQEIDEKSSRIGRKSVSVDLFAEESVERKTMNSLAEYFQSRQKKF